MSKMTKTELQSAIQEAAKAAGVETPKFNSKTKVADLEAMLEKLPNPSAPRPKREMIAELVGQGNTRQEIVDALAEEGHQTSVGYVSIVAKAFDLKLTTAREKAKAQAEAAE